MTGAELAALVAGTGVLMLAFAAFNIASHSLLDSRLRIFVRRAPVVVPASVRKPHKESSVAWDLHVFPRTEAAYVLKNSSLTLSQAGI